MYKNLYRLILVLLIASGITYSQTEEQKAKLLQLSRDAEIQYKIDKHTADSIALLRGFPIRLETSLGQTIELQRIEDGFPVYYATDNSISSQTVSTVRTYQNQIGGFNLSGSGVNLGVWDAGAVLVGHQEFQGRATQRDGAVTTHYHATHVGGTMVAGGVDARAKGMSFQGSLNCYDWNGDYSEVGNAAANGLRVSSHSYGTLAGWNYDQRGDGRWAWNGNVSISASEDYKFGFYDANAVNWDNLLYNAPYILVCKSAGNDRGDGPPAGTEHWAIINGTWTLTSDVREKDGGNDGYDCIGDGRAAAKNILTVGAVTGIPGGYKTPQEVTMSSFSSWGPTDDGRIKPDIVADGVNLYSTTNTGTSAYTSMSGTSMSTPSVSGSVGILLQQQAALYGPSNPFRSSTMKGLIIHTADECGPNNGPDYVFGWGLMNTLKAVKVMTLDDDAGNVVIKEPVLAQGSTYEYPVQSNGNQPLKVTICWTDIQGPGSSPALNDPSLKLINDLDLRVTGPGGTFMPWVLNPSNPSAAATTGDNFRDNVEQVVIYTPAAGTYSITVTHKGSLYAGSQNFSLIVTGHILPVPETVPLVSPANGTLNLETKPLFKWQLAPKGYDYQMQVALDSLFNNIVVDSVVQGVFVQFYTNLPELKKLYWRVRGLNSGGTGQWSQVWNFTTQLAIPDPPELVFPVNNAVNVKSGSNLVWSTESTVDFFRTQVSQNVLFTSLIFNDSTLTDTTVILPTLAENKKLYWRVRGKNASGIGEYSAINSFYSAVKAPDSLTAELLTDLSVKLDWKDHSAVETRYYVLRKTGVSGTYELLDSLAANSLTYTDTGLSYSTAYYYAVYCGINQNFSDSAVVTINTPSSVEDEKELTPTAFSLSQNYPNPFNPSTLIKYGVPVESNVRVIVYNALGQVVSQLVNSTQPAGYYQVKWNASNLSSGIYFYSIEAAPTDGSKNFNTVRKMLLLK